MHHSPQLYLITPDHWATNTLCATTEQLLATGQIGILQYRNKSQDTALQQEQAHALCELAHRYAVTFFVNDHVALAHEVGADGVHIGADDGNPLAVRQQLDHHAAQSNRPSLQFGISGYNQPHRLEEALIARADYVAFGAIYPSSTKPHATTDQLTRYTQLIQTAKSRGLKTVAIGGLTPANIAPLVAAGIDALAVISAIYAAPDPVQAVHDFHAAIEAAQP
jgi:thiamine-phosphate pyrophosphorylase